MKLEQLKIKLGYGSVQSMLDLINLKHHNVHRIKVDNPVRYDMILSTIVLRHYDISLDNLINMLDNDKKCNED